MVVEDVKKFINYFARKEYSNNEEKNDFFSNFIRRVILYDNRVIIFYNLGYSKKDVVPIDDTAFWDKCNSNDDNKKATPLNN